MDVCIWSDTGWYKRVLDAVNVHVTTGVPYTHTSSPLCERQNRVVEQNLRILMKQESTKDWVCLLPWAVLTMNSQERFIRAFPCNKKIIREQTVKTLVQQWFDHYGAPKKVHSDKDVRIWSDTGLYKRVLDVLDVHVSTGVPYTHTSNPLCER